MLVFPVQYGLERLFTTQIMTRPTRRLEHALFNDRLRSKCLREQDQCSLSEDAVPLRRARGEIMQ